MILLRFKKLLSTVCALLFLVSCSIAQTGVSKKLTDTARALRLFVIGNSFSGNATKYLPQIAESGNYKIVIGRAELGGCSLQRHWESVEAAEVNPEDSKGKPYKDKSLRMLLSEGKWDIVTIQQYSLVSGDVNTYRPYAKKLYDFIKALQPEAKILIHQTWAYRADADSFGKVKGNVTAKSQQEMFEQSRKAYHTIAKELKVGIIPSGDAFYRVDNNLVTGYKRDITYNYTNPTYPALPNQTNSLHVGYTWNSEKKFSFDSHHASAAGCYLGGLVWYSYLFNRPAKNIKYKPEEVDAVFADFLKEAADEVVQ